MYVRVQINIHTYLIIFIHVPFKSQKEKHDYDCLRNIVLQEKFQLY